MEFEKVRNIIMESPGCDAEKVTPEAKLNEDLDSHSLTSLEVLMAPKEAVGISIDNADVVGLKTVGDILAYLKAHL